MANFRTILFVVGVLLCALAAMMLLPALIDIVGGSREWVAMLTSALVTAFLGIALCLAMRERTAFSLNIRDAFLLTSLSWLAAGFFCALPFMLSPAVNLSAIDALFESVSGLTTTGSTVIVGLDKLPRGILFWRAFLQGLGGVGIIILAIVLLPFLRVGGMQLFRAESSDRSEKIVPSSFELVRSIILVYAMLALICAVAYRAAGMSWFDAVTHAMPTLSTGGFSTHDASFIFFDSALIDWIAILFMTLGSLPLVLYVRALRADFAILRDVQVYGFIAIVSVASIVMAFWVADAQSIDFFSALRRTAFSVVSVVSTTGFANADYVQWGTPAAGAFLLLILLGGCTGSTAGGIKIYRLQIMYLMIRAHIVGLLSPRRMYTPTFGGRRVDAGIALSVLAFFAVYMFFLFVFTLGLAATGLDLETSLSGAATALSNVGPGLGTIIGPAGNFSTLNDPSKVMLTAAMLLGRLEFFTLLVLFSAVFRR